MKHSLRNAALATLTSGTLLVGMATVASATDGTTPPEPATTLQEAKAACHERIMNRTEWLAHLMSKVASDPALTADHRAALEALLNTGTETLNRVWAAVDVEDTGTGATSACQQAVFDDRAFTLKTAQVHLVIRADRESNSLSEARTMVDQLQAAITAAKAKGMDVTKAQTLLANAQRDLKAAWDDLSGFAQQVIALQPGDYDANPNLISPLEETERNIRTHLDEARMNINEAMRFLQNHAPSSDARKQTPAPSNDTGKQTTNLKSEPKHTTHAPDKEATKKHS